MSSVKDTNADAILVRQCLAGDTRAFDALVHKYQKPLYHLALRMVRDRDDAMDIVQGVFVKVYQKLDSYDDRHEFFSWVYRITINESINFTNRSKRNQEYQSGETVVLPPAQEAAHNATALSAEIGAAIDMLKLDYRMVIVLKHYHDFSYQEMAEILGIPEKTVKSRLFSARQQLKEILTARGVTQ
jgi:RNA polymerase sigma-70 factor (ECF subfamily)